jgi:hypothetical protein
MKHDELLDLYSDYGDDAIIAISSFGATTATGLSNLLEGDGSHDPVTRFLASRERTSAELWHLVQPQVRRVQSESGVLILDDSIAEKPLSDENASVSPKGWSKDHWHYDHSKQAQVKGINFMTAL